MIFDLLQDGQGDGIATNTAVMDFTDSLATEAVDFLQSVVTNYWGTILSVAFVLFMIGLFWRMAKMKAR